MIAAGARHRHLRVHRVAVHTAIVPRPRWPYGSTVAALFASSGSTSAARSVRKAVEPAQPMAVAAAFRVSPKAGCRLVSQNTLVIRIWVKLPAFALRESTVFMYCRVTAASMAGIFVVKKPPALTVL